MSVYLLIIPTLFQKIIYLCVEYLFDCICSFETISFGFPHDNRIVKGLLWCIKFYIN